ncbi:MAG: hypothetical protein NTX61_04765 [Bacteroidetes bacterium]|nr:hypothetical protein [Bacteroidota bacterium]
MKKNRNIIIIVVILAIVAIVLVLTQSRTTFKRALSDFAVDDTANVTKIFMADKNNNTLKLTRLPNGSWQVNDKYPGMRFNIDMLLSTMLDLQVKEPVAIAARDNIIRKMAVTSVKVEIYQWKYRINIFGKICLFPHEKLTKVYYVGNATQSNRGTFMLMEGSSEPFVTFLPGLRGFLTPRYMPIEKYWRDYTIFRKNIHEIASVKVEFPSAPVLSYMIRNNHERGFTLTALYNNQEIRHYDTLKVMNFMSSFSKIGFEALLNDIDKHRKDSILSSPPFHIITVTDTSGVSTSIRTFHRGGEGESDENGNTLQYDRDRMFALVNNGHDFTVVQFLVFDPITRPITFFLKGPVKYK